jgi:beta-galactosidase
MRTILAIILTAAVILGSGPAAQAAFPPGFRWGTAVAGFQVEMGGAASTIDQGSDWYAWTHDARNRCDAPFDVPSCVPKVTKDVPEDGPNYYELFAKDHAAAKKKLKNNTFRLSIEWSRIFPASTVSVDVSGGIGLPELAALDALADPIEVAHYRAVLQSLQANGLEPFVTLNHFALPLWIHDPIATRDAFAGVDPSGPLPVLTAPAGWLDTATVTEFQKFAAYLGWKFGDLCDWWAPLNEPMVVAVNGFVNVPGLIGGNFPPGVWSFTGAVATIANEIAANAVGYDAVHAWDTVDADGDGVARRVGIVHNMVAFHPLNPAVPADITGAQNASYIFNKVFPNAVFNGDLDLNVDGIIQPAEHIPSLAGKSDFLGLNYYFRATAQGIGAPLTPVIPLLNFLPTLSYGPTNCPSVCTEFGWEIYPQGLGEVLVTAGSYGVPVYITENGIADNDDDQRPAYLVRHLLQIDQAIAGGVADIRGYFHWTLVDNFEWSAGYQPSFGLFDVDPLDPTHRRKLRKSGRLYKRIVRKNAIPQPLITKYTTGPIRPTIDVQ